MGHAKRRSKCVSWNRVRECAYRFNGVRPGWETTATNKGILAQLCRRQRTFPKGWRLWLWDEYIPRKRQSKRRDLSQAGGTCSPTCRCSSSIRLQESLGLRRPLEQQQTTVAPDRHRHRPPRLRRRHLQSLQTGIPETVIKLDLSE